MIKNWQGKNQEWKLYVQKYSKWLRRDYQNEIQHSDVIWFKELGNYSPVDVNMFVNKL